MINKTTLRLALWLVIALLAVVSVQAGSLEPPPGPVSPTNPPDTCFDTVGRYAVCGDGTVKDNLTGLFWLANANCFNSQNWPDASLSAAQLADGQCGLTDGSLPGDWRLPTIEEWQVILDAANANGCGEPTVPDVVGTGCCGTATCAFSVVYRLQSGQVEVLAVAHGLRRPDRKCSTALSTAVRDRLGYLE